MKRNGFTLTELLGVIIVLGMIALIVFPNINKSIKNSKNKIYQEQVSLIEENARRWGIDHIHLLPDSGSYYLELNELVTGGYVSKKEIKDPRNESVMNGCVVIAYNNEYNQYEYNYVETTCEDTKPAPTLVEKVSESKETMNNDPDKNVRYVGTDPNNYVTFNNELWRIIGIFNGQAKIIKNDFYSTEKSWDANNINDWTNASLQTELNVTYYNSIDAASKRYIDTEHVWNLGGYDSSYSSSGTRANFYNQERGTTVYSGRPTTWTGAIALMYPSDWGYASSSSSSACDTTALYQWANQSMCYMNSWLYNSSYHQWTLTSHSDYQDTVFYAHTDGFVNGGGNSASGVVGENGYVILTHGVRPVLYLKSDVKVTSGNGTISAPFQLTI